jgi:hypothetical protein
VRFNVGISFTAESLAALRSRLPLLEVDAIGFSSFDLESPLLPKIFEATRGTTRLWMGLDFSFEAAELTGARFVQPMCRRLVHESDREKSGNFEAARKGLLETAHGTRIHLLDRLELRNIRLKPNAIGGLHWIDEYVIGAGVVDAFRSSRLRAFEPRPILDRKTGQPHRQHFHLYTRHVMPLADYECARVVRGGTDSEGDEYRLFGCLVYEPERLDGAADFNRTAEPWSSNGGPLWVLCQRVRRCFAEHKLTGWQFRPVLEKGTPLHEEYFAKWRRLQDMMAINPQNRF